jgi:hypothetical protein
MASSLVMSVNYVLMTIFIIMAGWIMYSLYQSYRRMKLAMTPVVVPAQCPNFFQVDDTSGQCVDTQSVSKCTQGISPNASNAQRCAYKSQCGVGWENLQCV